VEKSGFAGSAGADESDLLGVGEIKFGDVDDGHTGAVGGDIDFFQLMNEQSHARLLDSARIKNARAEAINLLDWEKKILCKSGGGGAAAVVGRDFKRLNCGAEFLRDVAGAGGGIERGHRDGLRHHRSVKGEADDASAGIVNRRLDGDALQRRMRCDFRDWNACDGAVDLGQVDSLEET
jgi:hypothetical protein